MPKIAVLPGDGIGPEVTAEAVKALRAVATRFGRSFEFVEAPVGGAAYDAAGHPLPPGTMAAVRTADAVLFGAVGGPRWDDLPAHLRPEQGALLPLRKELGLYANLRPARTSRALLHTSPLRAEILGDGFDVLVVRELTGGLYFAQPKRRSAEDAVDTLAYSAEEIRRILQLAFTLTLKRRRKLCSVDKANVLETSRLWREIATEIGRQFPQVELTHMYVDNAAMQLVRNPRQFDVIVTENTFGDILTDEASAVTGSIGLLPSASIGTGRVALYEPIHGSAPDIAGQGKANPLGAILSAAMMLRHSFGMEQEAQAVEGAVERALDDGLRTGDIMTAGGRLVSTSEMGDAVAARIG